jgi:hypothetical protein
MGLGLGVALNGGRTPYGVEWRGYYEVLSGRGWLWGGATAAQRAARQNGATARSQVHGGGGNGRPRGGPPHRPHRPWWRRRPLALALALTLTLTLALTPSPSLTLPL